MTLNDCVLTQAGSRAFSERALRRGPTWLRDRVMQSALTDILGVDLQDSSHAISTAYTERATQVNAQFGGVRAPEDRAAVLDLLAILIHAHDILTDSDQRERYFAADLPNFAVYCTEFSFAAGSQWADLEQGSAVRPRRPAPQRARPGRRDTPQPAGPVTGPLRPTPVPSRAPVRRVAPAGRRPLEPVAPTAPLGRRVAARKSNLLGSDEHRSGQGRAGGLTLESGMEPSVPKPGPVATRDERPAPVRISGLPSTVTATNAPLVFGVGVARRGLLHVGGIYAVAFVASLLLLAAGLGARELSLDAGDGMIVYRALLLFGLAVGGVCLLRRESPLRFGLLPRWGVVIALPVAAALGWIASVMARFDIEPGNTDLWGTLAVLVAVRAVGEATFFQGFVTRTLLVELRNPALAVLASGLMYGLYGATYSVIAGGTAFETGFACFLYAFGGGLPMGLMYAKVRSLPALIVCNWIILMGSAWGGVSFAAKLAG